VCVCVFVADTFHMMERVDVENVGVASSDSEYL